MSDLRKMKDDKLDLFMEHIKKEIDHLEFKLQVGKVSGLELENKMWSMYHYFLTVLLQVSKEEKKRRNKGKQNDSKRVNKSITEN